VAEFEVNKEKIKKRGRDERIGENIREVQ